MTMPPVTAEVVASWFAEAAERSSVTRVPGASVSAVKSIADLIENFRLQIASELAPDQQAKIVAYSLASEPVFKAILELERRIPKLLDTHVSMVTEQDDFANKLSELARIIKADWIETGYVSDRRTPQLWHQHAAYLREWVVAAWGAVGEDWSSINRNNPSMRVLVKCLEALGYSYTPEAIEQALRRNSHNKP
jgi:hypothetical protein